MPGDETPWRAPAKTDVSRAGAPVQRVGSAYKVKVIKESLFATCIALAASTSAGASPVSGLTFSGNGLSGTGSTSTRGYAFSASRAGLVATHLGVFDGGADGLGQSHAVGL